MIDLRGTCSKVPVTPVIRIYPGVKVQVLTAGFLAQSSASIAVVWLHQLPVACSTAEYSVPYTRLSVPCQNIYSHVQTVSTPEPVFLFFNTYLQSLCYILDTEQPLDLIHNNYTQDHAPYSYIMSATTPFFETNWVALYSSEDSYGTPHQGQQYLAHNNHQKIKLLLFSDSL